MIVFSGNLSEKSKSFLLKMNSKFGLFISLIVSIFFGAIIIVIAAVWDFWIITWFMTVLILFIILATTSPYIQREKTLNIISPKKISIEEDGHIYLDLKNVTVVKALSNVTRVIDMGEWYYIRFHFPKVDGILCQKNLINEGTTDDFEKLFKEKIIRRY